MSDINHMSGEEDFYWGCVYNASKYKSKQNLKTPLRKDSFQLWQRSWAVLRIHAWAPGVWQFHCHMEQHIPLGMIMALNVLPSQQPPIPGNVPTEGPCPLWSAPKGLRGQQGQQGDDKLLIENEHLRVEVQKLENELKLARA